MSTHIFGIRHHGPGSARSLRAALDELTPDVVAIEGPADADDAIGLAGHEQLKPPVALLVYPPDEPADAAYYPFAEFSPEWQALRWAAARGVPVRLIDLPQSHQIAQARQRRRQAAASEDSGDATPASDGPETDSPATTDATDTPAELPVPADSPAWRVDPLAVLAQAAGYTEHELWWEHQVESRRDASGLFAAIFEAMQAVRAELPPADGRDLCREAFMRRTLRAVRKEGFAKIAVICGAWHAPVLDDEALDGRREGCKISDDDERLRGLPKIKTASTWIPWTHSRLTYRSGYGAGVHSPGWYAHLWNSPAAAGTRWVATAARLLREADLDASSASVIEAVRLADALAAMRDLRSPGLAELNEAILSIFCHGEPAPLQLIRNRLEIGACLGEVPEDAPSVPLAQDLARLQRTLRLKPTSEVRLLDLDLRNATDLQRSRLLHRLNLLDIPWGTAKHSERKTSTFHEIWQLAWQPEFAVKLIEANVWGNAIEAAACGKVVQDAQSAQELAPLVALLDVSLQAALTAVVDPLVELLQSRAAVAADTRQLMEALLPLARLARYGDVRGTRAEQVEPLLVGLFERAAVGLRPACAALDEEAAERMLTSIGSVTQALDLLERGDLASLWLDRLETMQVSDVHPLLRGWCCRLLLEKGRLSEDDLERTTGRELSPAGSAADSAAWATGLLRGSGLILLHQDRIWSVFDRWLSSFTDEAFVDVLPLLRRAFADFAPAERRQMGDKVKHLGGRPPRRKLQHTADAGIDEARAARVLPVLAHILGGSVA